MSQTTTSPAPGSQPTVPSPSSPQSPNFWRGGWYVVLTLWGTFIVALSVGVAQSLGNHVGPALLPLLPQILGWAQAQSLFVQIGLGMFTLAVLAGMVWLTILAWRHRQQQAVDEIEAGITRQREAFRGELDSDVKPRLERLQAGVEHSERQGVDLLVVADRIETDVQKLSQNQPLPLVRNLKPDLFKMGDQSAERVAYYRKPPVEAVFASGVAVLRTAASLSRLDEEMPIASSLNAMRGILIMGEANAGKSRMMFEVLMATLPGWSALLWSEARTTAEIPPTDVLHERDVVIILDDLQNFVTAGMVPHPATQSVGHGSAGVAALLATGPEAVLRELIRRVRADARHTVIVATCRTEHKRAADAKLNWLMMQLAEMTVPRFSGNIKDPRAADILEFFRAHNVAHPDREWDGTIGSAVLGLKEKRAEYRSLVEHHHPAATILRAMKLLAFSGVAEHTERRIRQTCADVFGERILLDNKRIWYDAVGQLLDLEFIRLVTEDVDANGNHMPPVLVIRKDTYFVYIVDDYPDPRIPAQLERDRTGLQQTLSDMGDARALLSLGAVFATLGHLKEGLVAINQSLAFDAQNANAWLILGGILLMLQQIGKALAPFQQAVALDPENALSQGELAATLSLIGRSEEALAHSNKSLALNNKMPAVWALRGIVLSGLNYSKQALAAYQQAIELGLRDAFIWSEKGEMLVRLERYEEALAAYDQALALDPNYAYSHIWREKGDALYSLAQYNEALAAYDQALALNPNDISAWNGKGNALDSLSLRREALATFDRALELNPRVATVWRSKAALLNRMGRHSEALAIYDEALALAPKNARAWWNTAYLLAGLGNHGVALSACEQALTLDPKNWLSKGVLLYGIKRYEDALHAFDQSLATGIGSASTWSAKGLTLYRLERHEESLAACNRALAIDSSYSLAWGNKGNALVALGRYGEAVDAFNHALDYDSIYLEDNETVAKNRAKAFASQNTQNT